MSIALHRVPGAAITVLLLAACGPVIESMRVTPAPVEPRPAGHAVRIYLATQPRCPFEEIALLTAKEGDLMRHAFRSDHTADLLRKRARQLGGDAIVGLAEVIEDEGLTTTQTVSRSRTADSTESTSSVKVQTDVAPNRTRRLEGTVVRFTRDDCRD